VVVVGMMPRKSAITEFTQMQLIKVPIMHTMKINVFIKGISLFYGFLFFKESVLFC
jgi:hypothetical protein